jgi:uncharacterized protein (DUF885 family)
VFALAPVVAQDAGIDAFFTRFSDAWVERDPNLAVRTRYFTGEKQDRLERQITSITPAARRQRVELARRGLTELAAFDRASMAPTQRMSADLLEWQLRMIVDGDRYEDYFFPLEQFGGTNVGLVTALTVTHPLRTVRDAENYAARMREVRPRLQEAIGEARDLAARGMIPPRFIIDATLASMREFMAPPAADNPFVTAFADRAAAIDDLPAARRRALQQEIAQTVEREVYPEWRQAIALLESIRPRATDDAGLWRLPGGPEAYAWLLQRHTTTTLTADEIHEIGLRRVREIETEMDAILGKLGRTQGPVKDRIAQLKKDLAYPMTDEGRRRIIADIEEHIRDAETRAASQFDRRPRAPVIVQPYPAFREASAAASYTAPPLDGSRPGIFQIPLRPDYMTRVGLRTLVYHETVPGHHFQIALNGEDQSLPAFRQARLFGGIAAVSEGWALYAERLAAESGWYEGDLEGRLGQLDDELFRARRLVVDTGLHAKRWTRQQAIDYGIDASEVERYVVNPGQACSYMIGQLRILALRDRARQALSRRFSERAFHNAVLAPGVVPLHLLEREIDTYIASASK